MNQKHWWRFSLSPNITISWQSVLNVTNIGNSNSNSNILKNAKCIRNAIGRNFILFLQGRRKQRQLRLPVDRLHIKTRSPTADYHFAIFVQRGGTMKLSRTFTDEKTKTDIYSKQAARNRCKFVPTLCCPMPSHKESSYIVKSLPNARLPNKWPFRHVGGWSKRAIRGQIDENPPLIDIEQQRCPARRSLCHYNFYFLCWWEQCARHSCKKCFCLREPVFWGRIFLILRRNFPNME